MNVKEEGVPKYLEKRGEESRWQRIAKFGFGNERKVLGGGKV